MPAEKTTAIVLKVVDFSETSCVVTLMSRDFGKISALAKGARRKKSPFEGALDVLAICRIVFLPKTTDALDLLTEAKLQKRFRSSSRELVRYYSGLYVVELLMAMTDHHDPHPDLFDLAIWTIEQLDGDADPGSTLLRFEWGALTLLGHCPALSECSGCGQPIGSNSRVAFGMLAGGVLCNKCRVGKRSVVSVTASSLDVIRKLADPVDSSESPGIEKTGEIRGLLDQYLSHLLGFRPKMQPYLRQVFNRNVST